MNNLQNKSIGIIGCGLIADTHVEAIKEALPDAVISVCDPLPGKAELLRRKYNLKNSYTSIEEMLLQENPFSVHILSPPQFHVGHAIQCLEAGCHVLVEKPVAFHSIDVDKLYDSAKKLNKVVCVDHILLQQPSILKMLRKLYSGNANQVLFVNSFFGLDMEGKSFTDLFPRHHWKQGLPGGPIMDNVIHPISLAVELTGKPVDIKTHFIGTDNDPEDVHISWQSEKSMISIVVSSRAQPFRRVTEITTNKQTFIVDHSTEVLVSLGMGFGPKALRKLLRNFGYAFQLTTNTINTVIQVLRGKLKENPGVRGVVKAYYKHLIEGSEIPVSEENVRNSMYAFEKIVTALENTYPKECIENNKNTSSYVPGDRVLTTLVTGGAGYLGSHVSKTLVERGRKVIAQVRRGPKADQIQSPHIEKIFLDFNHEPVDYNRLVQGVNEIIYCARDVKAKTWEEVEKINVNAALRLYDSAAKAGCEKFIFISSVAVYGVHQKGHISVNEKTPAIAAKSKWDYYIRSKTLAEKVLTERAEKGGPKLAVIRPGILYSADGKNLVKKAIPFKNGKLLLMFGSGKNHSPYTRVDILANTICSMLDMDPFPEGIFNMTGQSEENTRDFIYNRMIKLGVECRFATLPAFPFRFAASLLEFIYTVTLRKGPPKITRYIVDSSTRDIHYDCTKAEQDLGWNPQEAVKI